MPIGNGPDIEQFNRKEEEQIKLQDRVEKWWLNQEENFKYELIESYCRYETHNMDVDDIWNGLDWKDKWEIYTSEVQV